MDKLPNLTDWSRVQSFLAVAETGSLSAAARLLRLSQPTLGRHIEAFEAELGTHLFQRHSRGLRLNDVGQQLLVHAQEMNAHINALKLEAAGQDQQLEGTVRLTASVFVSHYLLPEILADIRAAEPGIQIELVPTDSSENLLFRAADIAVRMYRPTQLDIIARHVGDLELSVFAATTYLDRRGRPGTVDALWQHDLVGYDDNAQIVQAMREMGWPVTSADFQTRCDTQSAYWELVRAGCGIGFSQAGVGRADPAVEELSLNIAMPTLPMWLAAHPTMQRTPRISRVWDLIATGLTRHGMPQRANT